MSRAAGKRTAEEEPRHEQHAERIATKLHGEVQKWQARDEKHRRERSADIPEVPPSYGIDERDGPRRNQPLHPPEDRYLIHDLVDVAHTPCPRERVVQQIEEDVVVGIRILGDGGREVDQRVLGQGVELVPPEIEARAVKSPDQEGAH